MIDITSYFPAIRNVISFGSGVAVTVGILSASDQATIIDAITHIGADVKDIAKYVGIISGIAMPIWAAQSATVENLIRSLVKKNSAVQVVAPPAIAAVTPATSSAETTVVSKVSGQEVAKPVT